MGDTDRSVALTTACDDLQAQIEAGDRSFRHLDHDLALLRETLRSTALQTHTLSDLQQHLAELRGNMREQRSALREVRRAANKLCDTVIQARERMERLLEEKQALERTHAALLAESMRRHTPSSDRADHDRDGEQAPAQRFKRRLPEGETSEGDPSA